LDHGLLPTASSLGSHKERIGVLKLFNLFRSIFSKSGIDFSRETFRVLKEKDEKEFGEYRTRHLVLKAWDINRPSLPWVLLINKVAD